MNKKKIEAITEVKTPTTLKAVQAFVSLCSYYRKFIPKFAMIARPLTRLSQADVLFIWDEECENTFQKLETLLTEAPFYSHTPTKALIRLWTSIQMAVAME